MGIGRLCVAGEFAVAADDSPPCGGRAVGQTVETEQPGRPPATGHPRDRRLEDLGEPVEDGVGVRAPRDAVAAVPGPREQGAVQALVTVDGHDPLDQVLEHPRPGRVVRREETRGVEVAADQRVAPVDRQRSDQHRLDGLLGGVAGM